MVAHRKVYMQLCYTILWKQKIRKWDGERKTLTVHVATYVSRKTAGWSGTMKISEIDDKGILGHGKGNATYDNMDGNVQEGPIFIEWTQKWDTIKIEEEIEEPGITSCYGEYKTLYEFYRE